MLQPIEAIRYEDDPEISEELVQAVNEHCDIGVLLHRHTTAEEGATAAAFATDGEVDIVVPELLHWTDQDYAGINLLAQRRSPGQKLRKNDLATLKALRQKWYSDPYAHALFTGIEGSGASVKYIEPHKDDPSFTRYGCMDKHYFLDDILRKTGSPPFDDALPAFRRHFAQVADLARQRELTVRHNMVSLLGSLAARGGDKRTNVKFMYGADHAQTFGILAEAGISVDVVTTATPTSLQLHYQNIRSAMEGREVSDEDLARAMLSRRIIDTATYRIAEQDPDATFTDELEAKVLTAANELAAQVNLAIAQEIWNSAIAGKVPYETT